MRRARCKIKKFCDGFSPLWIVKNSCNLHQNYGCLSRNKHTKLGLGGWPASVWKTFLFLSGYKVIFRDAWVLSLPGSRFIHNFFRSNARTSRNNSVRILTLPGSTVPGRNSRCNPRTGTRWWTQAVHPVFPLSPASDIAFCPAPRKQTPSDLFHIFNAAHLLLKFPAFFLVCGWWAL